jgi:archaellum biogenesis ATPase FlaH
MANQKQIDEQVVKELTNVLKSSDNDQNMTSELLQRIAEAEKSMEAKVAKVDRIGSVIRLIEYGGDVHKFRDFMHVVEFINQRGIAVSNPIGIPKDVWSLIKPELLTN